MCCGDAAWKREKVPDHKFDFINIPDYHSKSCAIRLQYLWLYILVIKSFLVYMSDIFTAVTMISSDKWSNAIFDSCKSNNCVTIPFGIAKWLFVGCIIFSFLLLAYEAHKAKKITKSRDISYAFTNVMANNYYSLRSYDHFCFFCHIENSTKRMDDFAFFIFFTFKGWKRLLLADGPRQAINALTLYAFILAKKDEYGIDFTRYFEKNDLLTNALLVSTAFTVIIFAGSMILLIAAGIFYIPLLCYIQGNLKEYCCHKVDKRIAELMKRKNKQRLHKQNLMARKEAAGDFSHLKGKDGEGNKPLPQPTLPNVSLDDDTDPYGDNKSLVPHAGPYAKSLNYASSVKTTRTDGTYWNDSKDFPPPFPSTAAPDYPPMPMYDGLDYPPPPVGGYPPQYGDDYGRRTPVQNGYNPAQGGWAANPPDRYGGVPGGRGGTPVGTDRRGTPAGMDRHGTPVGMDRHGTPVGMDRRGTPAGRPPTRDRNHAVAPPYVDPNAGNRMSGLAYDMDDAYYSQGGGQQPPPADYSQWRGHSGGTAY